ncbi:hypothetical protein ACDZ28_00935 (plasmid) [Paenibacillus sp. RS8]|uniref:hypothetical protein n=1 Tax=Paenibacillus sp. RS8 TaxID=3242681 RepID=UPI0035C01370
MNEKFLSLLAIIIAIGTLVWQINQDIQGKKEELVIHSYQADPGYKFKITQSNNQVIIPFQYKILLANTGDPSISFINFKEVQVGTKTDQSRTNALSDVGFTSEEDKPVRLPFIIKSGEAIVLKHIMPISFEQESINVINQAYIKENGSDIYNKDITYYDLLYYSMKAGKDIFGNDLTGNGSRDEIGFPETQLKINNKNVNQPKFNLIFTSARNNEFEYTLTVYPGTK